MISFVSCSHCQGDECNWTTYREDLIRYWLECRQHGRGFGELGRVDDCNRRARKICYIKYNSYINVPPDTPCPTCVVVGLSYCFPSQVFEDGTELPNFLHNGKRDGHDDGGSKRKRVNVEISVNKYNF